MKTYFKNLYSYSAKNSVGSCGYVSLIQYLSYYDTFINDSIIPEVYDYNLGNVSSIQDAVTSSPGVIRQDYPSTDLYTFIIVNKSYDFQMYLMYIYNSQYGNTSDNYSYTIGMWKYYIILNYLYNNLVTFNDYSYDYGNLFEEGAKPTDSNVISFFDSYVKGKLDSGVPVILHIAKYNEETGSTENYHSVVAYYYDSQGIHANFGWESNSTDVIISPEYQITEADVADFSSLGHSHSNNYLVNNMPYCGCGYYHAHSYTYTSISSTQHSISCSCGYYATGNHVWTVTSYNGGTLNTSDAEIQYIPLYVCTACDYQTTIPPIGYISV